MFPKKKIWNFWHFGTKTKCRNDGNEGSNCLIFSPNYRMIDQFSYFSLTESQHLCQISVSWPKSPTIPQREAPSFCECLIWICHNCLQQASKSFWGLWEYYEMSFVKNIWTDSVEHEWNEKRHYQVPTGVTLHENSLRWVVYRLHSWYFTGRLVKRNTSCIYNSF